MLTLNNDGSIIVQSDLTVLLDERQPGAAEAKKLLLEAAEAVKQSGSIHTYRLSPMTIWNAMSAGARADELLDGLAAHSRYELPIIAADSIRLWTERYGKLKLTLEAGKLAIAGDERILSQLEQYPTIAAWIKPHGSDGLRELVPECRGWIKQELIRLGYPAMDDAGYCDGDALAFALRETTRNNRSFTLRDYQMQAASRVAEGEGGSGVVVLPCGTGKTIVGIAAMERIGAETLILTSSTTSAEQWREELLDKTTLTEQEVGLYSGKQKQARPVTIATYNLLTYRKAKGAAFAHMSLFSDRNWGLIIYDEVHLLPAPVFRMTASIQGTRRIGLTATLVREDGCAEDVYSLIGPKRFDMNWKAAEADSHISAVSCAEIRVPLPQLLQQRYMQASPHDRLRIAAENPDKLDIVRKLLHKHADKPTLIIGQYLQQLNVIAEQLGAPLLTGQLPQQERLRLYEQFKSGQIKLLVVSKVANLAVDLPDAAVAIQLSGSFGSRQEEAQRIGRLLRPKAGGNEAWFYTVVTEGTKETEFALKRQLFMLEQGYVYKQLQIGGHGMPGNAKEAVQG